MLVSPALLYHKEDTTPESIATDALSIATAHGCIGEISQKEFEIFMLGHELED